MMHDLRFSFLLAVTQALDTKYRILEKYHSELAMEIKTGPQTVALVIDL